MKHWPSCVLLFGSFHSLVSKAQVPSYDDVGIIVNTNSAVSLAIGSYFVAARNIPAENVIPVNAPLYETIDFDAFDSIRAQVESYLIEHDLVNSLNYIVTTKGFPLRIEVADCDTLSQFSKCSAVDSELALLLGPLQGSVMNIGSVNNPFFSSTSDHQRSVDGIYLVTRLDALTQADVFDLIDRSGAGLPIDRTTSQLIGDVSNFTDPDITAALITQMNDIFAPMAAQGWNVSVETTDAMPPATSDVAVYVGLDALPTNGIPDLGWTPGGFGFEGTVNSAVSFDPSEPLPLHIRTASLISSGATGARGNVAPVWGSMNYYTTLTLQRYLDTTYHFNLAESAYAGITTLSWMYEVIGDPKTSIAWVSPNALPEQDLSGGALLVPNPSQGHFALVGSFGKIESVQVLDQIGRTVPVAAIITKDPVQLDLSKAAPGIYVVRIKSGSGQLWTVRAVLEP